MPESPLPMAQPSGPVRVGHSKRARWRIAVLLLIHLVFALHIVHWQRTGRTLTPVEPSEAMQTLELGYVNAGFVLFALLILSTLVFGRFFCGWGCHVVALQDACGWMLSKFGIRPRAIRSRLLVWVPFGAALYMFVWPSVLRLLEGRAAPAWVAHFTTEDFWATFPNVWISLLTFAVCGFLIVYLLGHKAFCTYGCPYGGFFYYADKLAPGRIRVTDACNQCGHCTAVCTSNVRVHEEVHRHRMVVDSGCMKCMDCVSICPNQALYFGFGSPFSKAGKPAPAATRPYDFTWPEELGMAALFFASFYAFRGLYEAIPFLLSLGLSAIVAFLGVHAVQLVYKKQVRFQRWQLKRAGKLLPGGVAYSVVAGLVFLFVAHSAVVQWHAKEAARLLNMATAGRERGLDVSALTSSAKAHAQAADAIGLFKVAEWEVQLGAIAEYEGRHEEAARRFEEALRLDPDRPATRLRLANLYVAGGERSAAVRHFAELERTSPHTLDASWAAYGAALLAEGNAKEALRVFEAGHSQKPDDVGVLLNLGLVVAGNGDVGRGRDLLRRAVELDPKLPEARLNLGLVEAAAGRFAESERELRRALASKPTLVGGWLALADVLIAAGRAPQALQSLRQGLLENPESDELLVAHAQAARRLGAETTESAWITQRFGAERAARWNSVR